MDTTMQLTLLIVGFLLVFFIVVKILARNRKYISRGTYKIVPVKDMDIDWSDYDSSSESIVGNNPYDGADVADYEPSSSSSHSFGEGESCFEGTYDLSGDSYSSDYGSDE